MTVKIKVKWAGQDRRLPDVVIRPRPWRAPSRSGAGQPGSGVAIDWITGGSYSSATKAKRRLNVQSGLRKGKVISAAATPLESSRPRSWALKRCLREAAGPVVGAELRRRCSLWAERWSPLGALRRRSCAVREPEDHGRRRKKEGTYAVLLQSGLDEKW